MTGASIEVPGETYYQNAQASLDYSNEVKRWVKRHGYTISEHTVESGNQAIAEITRQTTNLDKTGLVWQLTGKGIGQTTLTATATATSGHKMVVQHTIYLQSQ